TPVPGGVLSVAGACSNTDACARHRSDPYGNEDTGMGGYRESLRQAHSRENAPSNLGSKQPRGPSNSRQGGRAPGRSTPVAVRNRDVTVDRGQRPRCLAMKASGCTAGTTTRVVAWSARLPDADRQEEPDAIGLDARVRQPVCSNGGRRKDSTKRSL